MQCLCQINTEVDGKTTPAEQSRGSRLCLQLCQEGNVTQWPLRGYCRGGPADISAGSWHCSRQDSLPPSLGNWSFTLLFGLPSIPWDKGGRRCWRILQTLEQGNASELPSSVSPQKKSSKSTNWSVLNCLGVPVSSVLDHCLWKLLALCDHRTPLSQECHLAHTTLGWRWFCQGKLGSTRTMTSAKESLKLGQPRSHHRPSCASSQPVQSHVVVTVCALEPGWPGWSFMTLPGRGRAGICDIRMLFAVPNDCSISSKWVTFWGEVTLVKLQ